MNHKLRILMVEDSEADAALILRVLERDHYEVISHRVETEEALRQALTQQNWDAVLCDYTLPQFSGKRALPIVRDLDVDMPFLYVSGTIGEDTAVEAVKSGAHDYVMKTNLKRLVPALERELQAARVRRESRLAEATMRESEHKYRHLFEALSDAVFLIDEITGRILDTNTRAETLLGLPRTKILGSNQAEIFAPLMGGETSIHFLASIAAGSNPNGSEMELVRRTGEPITVHSSVSRIKLYDRPLFLMVLHDITERKRMEISLQQANHLYVTLSQISLSVARAKKSEDLFRDVCSAVVEFGLFRMAWVGLVDEKTARLIPFCSNGYEAGYLKQAGFLTSLDQPHGIHSPPLLQGEILINNDTRSTPATESWSAPALERGYLSSASVPFRRNGAITGALILFADKPGFFSEEEKHLLQQISNAISFGLDRLDEQFEGQLTMESHARLASAIDQSGEMVLITDTDGLIRYVNPAFEKITGYHPEEVLGQNPRLLKSGKQDALFYQAMWECLRRGELWRGHFINRRKDGTLYEEDATISPIRNDQGKIMHYVAVKHDVTRELQLEAQFRQAQKMEAIGKLAGGIAHDFNNILTVIFGYGSMLQHETLRQHSVHQKVLAILAAANRAKDLVQQILTFSHQHEQKRQIIRLTPVIREATKFLRATLPSNIRIDLNLSADAPTVLADPTQIYQVTMNLATNALHAMEGHQGCLTVKLEAFTPDAAFLALHPRFRPISYAQLTVGDTGQGMNAEILDRIFEPFFTTKPAGKGTGLGLAVVHGILQSHDGLITVESRTGEGATFRLYFPAQTQVEPHPLSDSEKKDAPLGQGERILVIDDEPIVTTMLETLLQMLNYQVSTCNKPSEALALLRKNPDDYDLVITDRIMPEMNGLEVAAEIHGLRPQLPILLSTGLKGALTDEDLRKAGIRELLEKPVEITKLAETLHTLLDKKMKRARTHLLLQDPHPPGNPPSPLSR
jgi:PAS domain S-box-containing protein